jgi:hypothetical protein
MGDSCAPMSNQRSHAPGKVSFIAKTVTIPNSAGVYNVFDTLVQLPGWFDKIIIASEGGAGAYDVELWLSLNPSGISGSGSGATQYGITGNEVWIPIRDNDNGGITGVQAILGTVIEFDSPINQFYLSIGNINTPSSYTITFLCMRNGSGIKNIIYRPQGSGG